jgi:hypothetical protein
MTYPRTSHFLGILFTSFLVLGGYGEIRAEAVRNMFDARVPMRDDVLVYTGEVLDKPLEIIGPVWVELYVASSARDTDFTAKLVDVYPDGRAVRLGPSNTGIIRARFRNGFGEEELLTPGKVEKYQISLADLWAIPSFPVTGCVWRSPAALTPRCSPIRTPAIPSRPIRNGGLLSRPFTMTAFIRLP